MSAFDALSWAGETKTGSGTRKAVLFVLASHAGQEDNTDVWSTIVGQERIAAESEISERTVSRALAEMESAGLITRHERRRDDGYRTSDRTVLHVHRKISGDRLSGDNDDDLTRHGDGVTVRELPEVSTNRNGSSHEDQSLFPKSAELVSHETKSRNGHSHDLVFAAFWQIYPRHVGKTAARKAWEKAIRRADTRDIIAGAERYANDPNRDPEFTCHPSTWLNQGRWEDDPLPARNGSRRQSSAGRSAAAFDAVRSEIAAIGGNGHRVLTP